jgi:hypothetical protein
MKKHPRRSPNMRPFTRAIARSLIGASLLVPLLALTVPAQASTTALTDAEIRSVRLMDSGDVRVEVTYRCDERYGYGPPRIALHLEPDGWYDAWAGDGALCDGTAHTLVRRLKALDGQQIGERMVVYVDVSVADSPSDPYPAGLWAGGSDTYSVEPDGSLGRLADLRVQRTQVNDRGRLVVGMSYECPMGYYVDVEDDSDWADVIVYQYDGQDDVWQAWEPLGDDIVCDGTRHSVVRRFRTAAMDPTLPVVVNTKIIVRGPTSGASAWDAQTSWPH